MDLRTLQLDIQDGVALVTLDDPARRNAISLPMVEEIETVFDAIEAREDVGAVVVTGAPPAFCAGADLTSLERADRVGLRRIYEGFLRVGRCPLPTIAAVNGAAVGAGMNLALVCDLRLAAHEARFDCRFLDLGLHPGGGHTWMLRRLIGAQGAAAMVLFGEALDGVEAARVGLAWGAVAGDELLPAAHRMAAKAAAAPRDLLEEVVASHRAMGGIDRHRDAVERELGPQAWSVEQPVFAEKLAALRDRIRRRQEGEGR